MVEQQNNVLDAARKAGVKYLVRVSGGAAVAFADSPSVVGRGHLAIEERLKGSGIGWTILKPGLFMQNIFGQAAGIKNDGKLVAPSARRPCRIAFIDVRDTGAVGARILIDPAPHAGKTYEFTGKPTTFGAIRRGVRASARPARCLRAGDARTERAGDEARGMPDWLVDASRRHRQSVGDRRLLHREHQADPRLVKREPITTRQFVEDFKGLFA